MLIVQHNVVGQEVAPPAIPRARSYPRRRLSALVARHADRSRPFIVSVHRPPEALRPTDDTVRLRATWAGTLVAEDQTVVITYLPLGGGGGGSTKQIGGAVAMLALALAAPWAVGALGAAGAGFLGTAGALTFAGQAAAAGIVIGGAYLIGKVTAPNANSDTRPLYGVSGGGNAARPGDRIPEGFGTFWSQPDLTQADYSAYDGEDQLLYKRMTLGVGKYDVLEIGVGATTMWTKAAGIVPPFAVDVQPPSTGTGIVGAGGGGIGGATGSGVGPEVEIIQPGATSTLVPGSVYSSPSVGGTEIARAETPINWTGPFPCCPVGTTTTRIQLDYSQPNGCFHWVSNGTKKDTGSWGVLWEYAPCNEDDQPTGAYQTLYTDGGSMKTERAIRRTRFATVPSGRYLVRARNIGMVDDYPSYFNYQNVVTWDGMRAHFPDVTARPGITEIALRVRSGKNLGITNFSDVWVKWTRILPVWNGSAWVEQPTRKAVYAYKHILQSANGGNLPDNEVDLAGIKARAASLTEHDTFDGVIRGPVSVWEAAATVLGVMRAEPARIGSTWTLTRDEQKAVRKHVFTRRQIVRGSTSQSFKIARDDGAADVIVEYNPDGDPRRRRDVRVTFGAQSLTPRRLQLQGVSAWEHAHHLATWMAASAYYRRKRRRITSEYQGRIVQRGQPVWIDAWFQSPARAAGVLARSGSTVTLDTDVVLNASTYALFRDRRGCEWGPVKVTAGSGANVIALNSADVTAAEAASGIALAALFANDNEDQTSLLVGPFPTESFQIESVQPQGRDYVAIEAVHDAPQVWTALGETIPDPPPIPSRLDEVDPPQAVIAWLRGQAVQKAVSLDLEWSCDRARGAVSFIVDLSYDNGATWERVNEGPANSGSYALRHEPGATLKLQAYAVDKKGMAGPIAQTTLTTFKPVIDADAATVTRAALDTASQTALKKGEDAHALARAVRDSISSVESVRQVAATTGLVDPNLYANIDALGQAAIRLAFQAEQLDRVTREIGVEIVNGRYVLSGERALGDVQVKLALELDLNKAAIELRATRTELNAAVAAVAAGLQPAVQWAWNSSVEGWTGTNCTLTAGAGYLQAAVSGNPAYVTSPTFSVDADAYDVVRFTAQRTAGSGYGLSLQWGSTYQYEVAFAAPSNPADPHQIAALLSSHPNWTGAVTSIRLKITAGSGNTFRFSFGEIGKDALAALLVQGLQADIVDVNARLDAANALISLKASQTTVANQELRLSSAEATISAQTSAIGLRALNGDLTLALARITTAETTIDALNGRIRLAVDAVQTTDLLNLAGQAIIQNALADEAARARQQETAARASTELNARIDQEGRAIAERIDLLASQARDADASIVATQQTLAADLFAEATARQVVQANLTTEATTRAAGDATNATAIATEVTNRQAAIETEQSARVAADAAEASARQTVQANLNTEITNRAAGDTANADAITTEITNRQAAVTNEANARAAADAAEATARQSVQATLTTEITDRQAGDATNANAIAAEVTARAAAVTAEQNARVAADSAEASARQTVQANLTTEVTNRQAGDQANADAIATEVTNRTAAITAEASARVSADAAEATARQAVLASLNTEISDRIAAVTTEASARTNADSSLASQISTVSASLGDIAAEAAAAAITDEATARADGDSANASAITSLTATVGSNYATLSSGLSAQASATGNLQAQYVLALDIDGSTGGLVLSGAKTAGGTTTFTFDIAANVRIFGNLIVNGTVGYTQLQSGAATNIEIVNVPDAVVSDGGPWSQNNLAFPVVNKSNRSMAYGSFNVVKDKVLILWSFIAHMQNGDNDNNPRMAWTYQLKVDGTVVRQVVVTTDEYGGVVSAPKPQFGMHSMSLDPGIHTFELFATTCTGSNSQVNGSGGGTLVIIDLRK